MANDPSSEARSGSRAVAVLACFDDGAPDLPVSSLAAGISITTSPGVVRSGEVFTLLSARPPENFCEVQVPPARQPVESSVMGQVMPAFSSSTHPALSDRAELEQIRRRGFASVPDASDSSILALAGPVFDETRVPWGALGVRARRRRLTDATVRQILPAMHLASARIGRGPSVARVRTE